MMYPIHCHTEHVISQCGFALIVKEHSASSFVGEPKGKYINMLFQVECPLRF